MIVSILRRALGLAKAPAKLVKGEVTKSGLVQGESPAVVKYEKKATNFRAAVEAMRIEGDFAEFSSVRCTHENVRMIA